MAEAAQTNTPKAPLYAMALANFAVGTGALMLAGLVPTIAADIGTSNATAGQLITIYALVYAISAPVLSIVTSSWSKRRILVVAALGLAVTNGLAALAPGFVSLMALRGASALFAALITPVAASTATLIAPPQHAGKALGVVFGGFAVSTVLGVPAGALVGGMFGWEAAFWMVTGLSGLAALAILAFVPAGLSTPRADFADLMRMLVDVRAMSAVSLTAFQVGCNFIPFSFAAVLFADAFGAGPTEVFWLLMAFGAASVTGNIVGGALSDRFGFDRVILYGLIALPPAILALYLASGGLAASALAMALWGFVAFTYTAPQQSRIVQMRPDARTMILAFNGSALYVGTSLGSAIGGLLLATSGTAWLPLGGAIMAALAIPLYLLTRRLAV